MRTCCHPSVTIAETNPDPAAPASAANASFNIPRPPNTERNARLLPENGTGNEAKPHTSNNRL
ncbi:hypothetical protein GCM10022416_27800 [Actinomadura keratinilytica]|uniref:Uncharacterized protein n=1 Tax=Actinomadura keratinilytica TaxID=547461 RepID=A0ABP7YSB7_9ACTN